MTDLPSRLRASAQPVAWRFRLKGDTSFGWILTDKEPPAKTREHYEVQPLYTHEQVALEAQKMGDVRVTLEQVEELAKTMWKGEPVPGRVLRFGAAVLGLADAAAAGVATDGKDQP